MVWTDIVPGGNKANKRFWNDPDHESVSDHRVFVDSLRPTSIPFCSF